MSFENPFATNKEFKKTDFYPFVLFLAEGRIKFSMFIMVTLSPNIYYKH